MNKLLLLIIPILLCSCGVQKTAVTTNISTNYTPELNSISNSEIGITLVSKETGRNYKAIKITKDLETKVGYLNKTIKNGEIFINDFQTKKYDLFRNSSDLTYGIAMSKDEKKPIIYTNDINGFGLRFKQAIKNLEYKEIFVPVKQEEYFKQEFIYNGRVGNALKFIYREYVFDQVRPAFTQDLQYDLSESKIVGFRGLRIEILNATNTKIEYVVLNHFEK